METPNVETTNVVNSNLKTCNQCGHQVSKKAKTCPNCGARVKKKKGCLITLLVVLSLFLIILLLGMCGTSDSSSSAEYIDFYTVYSDCENNIAAAEDTYVGNTYQFSGIVKEIDNSSVIVSPLSFPSDFSTWYAVKVPMSTNDIKEVSMNQVITVQGKISGLFDSYPKVTMKNGSLVGENIEFKGTISKFILNESYTKHIMVIEITGAYRDYTGTYKDITCSYEVADADKFENIDEVNINGITFAKGMNVKGVAKMSANGAYQDQLIIDELVSIEAE